MYKYPKAIREPPPPPMKKDSRVQHVLKKTKTKMEVSISGFQSPRRARTGAIILSNGWAGMIRGEMTRKHSASHFQDWLGGERGGGEGGTENRPPAGGARLERWWGVLGCCL